MADQRDDSRIELGVFGRKSEPRAFGSAHAVAAVLTLLWLGWLALWRPDADWLSWAAGTVLPVALVWAAAIALHEARAARREAEGLRKALDALRSAYIQKAQAAPRAAPQAPRISPPPPLLAGSAEAPFADMGDPEAGPPRGPISQRPSAPLAPAPANMQASLDLGAKPAPPLSIEEFIRALNFPDSEDDDAGFRALGRALSDAEAGRLVRASQDILTLLSQDGLYMDDLPPDRARPELWRRFAAGARGRTVADLGGIRERNALAQTAERMRSDEIFRDAAHHFLRHFDRTFAAFEPGASDQDIADFSTTRTARAFMLIARVSGTFD